MLLHAVQLVIGLALVLMTLRDVFETVVVPGGSRAALHVTRRLNHLLLPAWRRFRPRRGISPTFAPALLVGSFAIWTALLVLGFGLMLNTMRHSLHPAARSFADALYIAGSSVATIGLSSTAAEGTSRWVIIAAGFCGLAVITMAVTYLLEVQSTIATRDVGILKLNGAAGDPPSALALLETYALLGSQGELSHILRELRDWCTTVRQSHTSHPSLTYFRSQGTGAGWPAALGTLLDLSLIITRIVDGEELRGRALLLRAEGLRMAEELGQLARLHPVLDEVSEEDVQQLQGRLVDAGYKLRPDVDVAQVLHERSFNMGWVKAMADHLGKPCAPFIAPPGASS